MSWNEMFGKENKPDCLVIGTCGIHLTKHGTYNMFIFYFIAFYFLRRIAGAAGLKINCIHIFNTLRLG